MPEVVVLDKKKNRNRKKRNQKKAAVAVAKAVVLKSMTTATRRVGPPKKGNSNVRAKVNQLVPTVETPLGREFVHAHLNPCDTKANALGIPDDNDQPVVTIHSMDDYRIEANMGSQVPDGQGAPQYAVGALDPELTWDLLVISDPSSLYTYFAVMQGTFEAPTYLAIFSYADSLRDVMLDTGFAASRVFRYGTTVEFTGPTIQNQGQATHGMMKQKWRKSNQQDQTTPDAPDTVRFFDRWSLGTALLQGPDPQALFQFLRDIAQADPDQKMMPAKEGAYACHRFNDPAPKFVEHDLSRSTELGNQKYHYNPLISALAPQTFVDQDANGDLEIAINDWSTEYYQLSAYIGYYTGVSTQSSFRLKKYYSIEAQIDSVSNFRFFTHEPCDWDESALHVVSKMAKKMPAIYPASYNSKGVLTKGFLDGLIGTIGGAIGNLVGGIPVIGNVLKPLVPGVINAGAGLIGGLIGGKSMRHRALRGGRMSTMDIKPEQLVIHLDEREWNGGFN